MAIDSRHPRTWEDTFRQDDPTKGVPYAYAQEKLTAIRAFLLLASNVWYATFMEFFENVAWRSKKHSNPWNAFQKQHNERRLRNGAAAEDSSTLSVVYSSAKEFKNPPLTERTGKGKGPKRNKIKGKQSHCRDFWIEVTGYPYYSHLSIRVPINVETMVMNDGTPTVLKLQRLARKLGYQLVNYQSATSRCRDPVPPNVVPDTDSQGAGSNSGQAPQPTPTVEQPVSDQLPQKPQNDESTEEDSDEQQCAVCNKPAEGRCYRGKSKCNTFCRQCSMYHLDSRPKHSFVEWPRKPQAKYAEEEEIAEKDEEQDWTFLDEERARGGATATQRNLNAFLVLLASLTISFIAYGGGKTLLVSFVSQ